MIDSFFQTFYPADKQIRFKWVPGTCRRHIPESYRIFVSRHVPHSLCGPEKIGKFQQGQRFLLILPPAFSSGDQFQEISLDRKFLKITGQGNRSFASFFLQRVKAWQLLLLVCLFCSCVPGMVSF